MYVGSLFRLKGCLVSVISGDEELAQESECWEDSQGCLTGVVQRAGFWHVVGNRVHRREHVTYHERFFSEQ